MNNKLITLFNQNEFHDIAFVQKLSSGKFSRLSSKSPLAIFEKIHANHSRNSSVKLSKSAESWFVLIFVFLQESITPFKQLPNLLKVSSGQSFLSTIKHCSSKFMGKISPLFKSRPIKCSNLSQVKFEFELCLSKARFRLEKSVASAVGGCER